LVNGYLVICNDATKFISISFDADNRPHLSAVAESIDNSPQQIQLNFKPCLIWLVARKRTIIINIDLLRHFIINTIFLIRVVFNFFIDLNNYPFHKIQVRTIYFD